MLSKNITVAVKIQKNALHYMNNSSRPASNQITVSVVKQNWQKLSPRRSGAKTKSFIDILYNSYGNTSRLVEKSQIFIQTCVTFVPTDYINEIFRTYSNITCN